MTQIISMYILIFKRHFDMGYSKTPTSAVIELVLHKVCQPINKVLYTIVINYP